MHSAKQDLEPIADTDFDPNAVSALGLHALQHRGQEAAGIVSFDGKRFHSERRLGLVADSFARREVIDRLPGTSAIGHVR